VQTHGCIGSASVDMHQHRLPAACGNGIAARHVNRGIFVGAQNQFGKCATLRAPMRHFFNQGGVICAQIAEQILYA
jgi:hypothetical protein